MGTTGRQGPPFRSLATVNRDDQPSPLHLQPTSFSGDLLDTFFDSVFDTIRAGSRGQTTNPA